MPENIDYSHSNSLKARISVACGIQSVGLDTFYEMITDNLYCLPCTTSDFLTNKTKQREYKSQYDKKIEVRRRRRAEKREKTKIELKGRRSDKKTGTTYGQGIAMYLTCNNNTSGGSKRSLDLVEENELLSEKSSDLSPRQNKIAKTSNIQTDSMRNTSDSK